MINIKLDISFLALLYECTGRVIAQSLASGLALAQAASGLAKCFLLLSFYMMSKMLTGKPSCIWTGPVC